MEDGGFEWVGEKLSVVFQRCPGDEAGCGGGLGVVWCGVVAHIRAEETQLAGG